MGLDPGRAFDVAIVDEVSMSYPAQVVVAAAHARSRVNVFGDCRQLPPIVLSESVVARERLGRDVFTACGADHPGASGVTMLKEQFRMHPQIRKVVSDFAYGGALRDAPGIEAEREPIARRAPLPGHAVAWLDVGPLGATRFFDRHHGSRFNPISALCCIRAAMELDGERAVILTPYRTQARLLGALVNDAAMAHVEVGTIHRYQGSEAPTVIVDLVDGSGTKVGQPFKGQGGERLLNVGLSRAQGKVIVVGNGTMPTQDLTRRSIAALASVRHHHKAPPSTPWSGTGEHGFAMSMQRGIPAPAPVDPAGVVAAWLPDELPVELRWLQGPHADRWEGGHPSWLGPGGSFGVFAVRPGGVVSITLAGAARFAEAMSDAITGSPLTRRPALDRATGKAPPKASRHDQCGRCGARAVPAAATRYRIELECVACHGVRQATDREVSAWMREVGPRCPHCGRGMRLISGPRAPYGPFLGCSGYPDCDGKMPLDAVLDAVDHPDPPPPEEPPRKSSRRRTAASTVSELDRRTCPSCFLSLPSTLFDPGSELCRDCS